MHPRRICTWRPAFLARMLRVPHKSSAAKAHPSRHAAAACLPASSCCAAAAARRRELIARKTIEYIDHLASIYMPYTFYGARFAADNTRVSKARLQQFCFLLFLAAPCPFLCSSLLLKPVFLPSLVPPACSHNNCWNPAFVRRTQPAT